MLAVIETHPVQYHAPIYRAVQEAGVPVTAIYGSDFSIAGYQDAEFGGRFAWDTDLTSGYTVRFLRRVAEHGDENYQSVRATGLRSVLREVQPTAILTLGYSSRFDRGVLWESLRTGRPLLFRGETTDHARSRSWWRQIVRDGLLRRFYRRCARLLYIGNNSYDHYRRLGCTERQLVFSPYCVATDVFQTSEEDRARLRDAARQQLGIAANALVILFSGKLVQRKGVDLLIDAVQKLAQQCQQPVDLVLLGDGELREQLECAAREKSVAVHFVGFQNQTKLSPYYHAADMLALPSRESETWGLVVNEALHHGVPCVVSDKVGCAPDLVIPGQTGEVFSHTEPMGLHTAMSRGLTLVGNAKVRNQCRAVVEKYSVAAAAAGIVSAYRDVSVIG